MSTVDETAGIKSFSGPVTPIGSVRFGGRLVDTGGTGFARYRVHGMFALVLLTGRGAGLYRDQLGTNRRVSAGDLIVVFPETPHQYGPEADDVWEEIFISFDGAAFEGWRASGLDPAHPIWRLPESRDWVARFSDVLQMNVSTTSQACAAASAVHLLITDALAEQPPTTDTHHWLEHACQLLSAGNRSLSIDEIAKNVGLGYETFRKIFKLTVGESPARYRKRMRLAQASLMLQRPDLTLEMIADALDFCDAFHLSKAFKNQYGISPTAKRRQMLK